MKPAKAESDDQGRDALPPVGDMQSDYFVRTFLLNLPSPEREVVTLRIVQGLSSTEIAKRLDRSVAEVWRFQRSGMRLLRQSLASRESD